MNPTEKAQMIGGHSVVYRDHRFVCLTCGTRLLNLMQFAAVRECPGPISVPPVTTMPEED